MHAEIRSYDLRKLNEFKNRYDGKVGVIGTEKIHANFEFEQIAATPTEKVFKALEDEYEYQLDKLRPQKPSVTFDFFFRKARNNISKAFIKIRGP